MKAQDVLRLIDAIEDRGIDVWVDGGWGVDALLGEQTRAHADLDIVVQHKDVPTLRRLLEKRGSRDEPRDDARPWNFVLADGRGREVDVHAITFDSEGNGLYSSPGKEEGTYYPAASLTGVGRLKGREVKCISAEWQVKFHSGYDVNDKDRPDVLALCDRFGLELPKEYR